MRKIKMITGGMLIALFLGIAVRVNSHCQIPCGIYDDPIRLKMISEHIETIEKSMKQIIHLSESDPMNMNQTVRWINNKEQHADELSEIVTHYFMAQRVKPVDAGSAVYQKYIRQLTLLHEMLVTSMKCKQTTDLTQVEKLKDSLKEFSAVYQE